MALVLLPAGLVSTFAAGDTTAGIDVQRPSACLPACRALGPGYALGRCIVGCTLALRDCRRDSLWGRAQCRKNCGGVDRRSASRVCKAGCRSDFDASLERCEVTLLPARFGTAFVPELPTGRAADMELLEPAERAVIEAADESAASLRSRELVVRLAGRGSKPVRIVQTRHEFKFGFPLNTQKFEPGSDDEAFFESVTRDQFDFAVLSSNAKWARLESTDKPPPIPSPSPEMKYEHVDNDIDWALDNGFEVKGHTLMWGIWPPISTSGVPRWLQTEPYAPDVPPPMPPIPRVLQEQRDFVRDRLQAHVKEIMQRYEGIIETWDVTNETLQPLAKWFEIAFAGEDIVAQIYHWAREANPDATLVFNEWIDEVFTGLDVTQYGLPSQLGHAPTAVDVRDRVLDLLGQDPPVPIDVLGVQAHFAPAASFAPVELRELLGLQFDLSRRTPIDEYAAALDTLAEAGLPIHITEVNFIAPDEPDLRAAHAEGLMRVWWGHPSVQQIVFWGPWNKIAGRSEFKVGLWNDDGELSRHGEAVMGLINERWRTDVTAPAGRFKALRLPAVRGEYAAQWTVKGEPVHATFDVPPGVGARRIVLIEPRRRR